ncbi:hypothetical protein R5M08_001074 [Providencia rettgeri]|nr:hypothetical protein [Providencia rettgeri]ELR5244662.1 hypothetical protein [Providencia rettgeri]ELS4582964.1 hypothetical protein [Providencia rettgeri]
MLVEFFDIVFHIHPLAVTLPSLIIGLRSRGCLRVSGADFSSSTKFAIGQSVPLYALYGLFLRSAIHASRRFKFHRCLEFMFPPS